MTVNALSWVVEAATIGFGFMLARKWRAGWVLALAVQPGWVWFAVMTGAWGIAASAALHSVIAVHGWVNWGRT